MYNILYLPLDDRPCNEQFPFLLPKADYQLKEYPKDMLGNKKIPANLKAIDKFLLDNASVCDAFVLSLDTLIYGGLISSRIHQKIIDELIKRLDVLKEIKEKNPNLKIFAFSSLMRCPNTNFDSEEPDYWTNYGKKIFRYGQLKDLIQTNRVSIDEGNEFKKLVNEIPEEVILDFEGRRRKNLDLIKFILNLSKTEKLFDYICLPQDDSNPIGWTAMDQREIKNFISSLNIGPVEIYPGADEVGMVLLSRLVSSLNNKKPKIFIHYSSENAGNMIPPYEDRPIKDTISSQIAVSNAEETKSEIEADIVLCVCIGDYSRKEFVSYLKEQKAKGKIVGVIDTYLPSGSDIELINELKKESFLLEIDGYASWNTASNSFGTVLAETIMYFLGRDDKGNKQFLTYRYVDDFAYCTYVRGWTDVNAALARGYCEAELDGASGTCVEMCKNKMMEYLNENIPEVFKNIMDLKAFSPWNRSFEMKFIIGFKE